MTPDQKKIFAGAASGFIGAFMADIHAWQDARKANPAAKFDWLLAVSRWGMGALGGATGAAGFAAVS